MEAIWSDKDFQKSCVRLRAGMEDSKPLKTLLDKLFTCSRNAFDAEATYKSLHKEPVCFMPPLNSYFPQVIHMNILFALFAPSIFAPCPNLLFILYFYSIANILLVTQYLLITIIPYRSNLELVHRVRPRRSTMQRWPSAMRSLWNSSTLNSITILTSRTPSW